MTKAEKLREKYMEHYEILKMMISLWEFTNRKSYEERIEKSYDYVKGMKRWLKNEDPKLLSDIDKLISEKRSEKGLRKKIDSIADILENDIKPEDLVNIFRDEIKSEIKMRSADRVKEMMDKIEDDLIKTREMTLKACMLAITWYFASVQKRVKEGKEIYTKEFKYAYDIYKTEMGEPIRIKETRHKNLQVTLNVPVDKEDVKKILGETDGNDMDIIIADEFKDLVDDRFRLVNIEDGISEHQWQGWETWPITEAEEIPG